MGGINETGSSRSRIAACFRRLRASALICLLLACGVPAFLLDARAAQLGGAYFVDDAEIGPVGSCEVESWASFAGNSDRIFVSNPACVFNLGRPVELGATYLRTRSDGVWGTTLAATAKTVLTPIDGMRPGVGVTGAVTYDAINNAVNGLIVTVPVTFEPSKQLRINVNGGLMYDPSRQQLFATPGAGFSWSFVKTLSLNAELFAIIGPGQTNPRSQVGLRYTPIDSIDFDVIYGRNLTGERANWITAGLNFRLGYK
jgi:hypothetical protein